MKSKILQQFRVSGIVNTSSDWEAITGIGVESCHEQIFLFVQNDPRCMLIIKIIIGEASRLSLLCCS